MPMHPYEKWRLERLGNELARLEATKEELQKEIDAKRLERSKLLRENMEADR